MAKRELSSTLKNLKFMQRAAQNDGKVKVELDEKPEENIVPLKQNRCLVIIEGSSLSAATKGRMSFQGFNPLIDKLNQDAVHLHVHHEQDVLSNSNISDRTANCNEDNFSGNNHRVSSTSGAGIDGDVELKRKQPEVKSQWQFHKKDGGRDGQSQHSRGGRREWCVQKREKVEWGMLRPRQESLNNKQVS